jgi:hypothetical protein
MARARSKCPEALDRGVLPGVPKDSKPSSSSERLAILAPAILAPAILVLVLVIFRRSDAGIDSRASPLVVDDPTPSRDDGANPVPTPSVEGKADGGVTNLSPRALDGIKKSAAVPEASPSPSLTPPTDVRNPAA